MNLMLNKYIFNNRSICTKEEFFEQVMGYVNVDSKAYEFNEYWFIFLIDSLYNIAPLANHMIVANYVQECWDVYSKMEQEYTEGLKTRPDLQYKPVDDLDDYPEFITHH